MKKAPHYAIKKTTNGFEMSEHLPVFGESSLKFSFRQPKDLPNREEK